MANKLYDYRVVQHDCGEYFDERLEYYDIREIYYDDYGDIMGMSEDAIFPNGDTLEDLKKDLSLASAALEKPVLKYSDLCHILDDLSIGATLYDY